MNIQLVEKLKENLMSRFLLATCAMLVVAGCAATSAPSAEEDNSTTSDALRSCGWLAGGQCTNLPAGNWRTPEFWGDFYLTKYGPQLQYALDNIEPGPPPIDKPRTVLLITGV